MSQCPNCHEDGEYYCDNSYTSVFWCRNDGCRVASFDHIPIEAAYAMLEEGEGDG